MAVDPNNKSSSSEAAASAGSPFHRFQPYKVLQRFQRGNSKRNKTKTLSSSSLSRQAPIRPSNHRRGPFREDSESLGSTFSANSSNNSSGDPNKSAAAASSRSSCSQDNDHIDSCAVSAKGRVVRFAPSSANVCYENTTLVKSEVKEIFWYHKDELEAFKQANTASIQALIQQHLSPNHKDTLQELYQQSADPILGCFPSSDQKRRLKECYQQKQQQQDTCATEDSPRSNSDDDYHDDDTVLLGAEAQVLGLLEDRYRRRRAILVAIREIIILDTQRIRQLSLEQSRQSQVFGTHSAMALQSAEREAQQQQQQAPPPRPQEQR